MRRALIWRIWSVSLFYYILRARWACIKAYPHMNDIYRAARNGGITLKLSRTDTRRWASEFTRKGMDHRFIRPEQWEATARFLQTEGYKGCLRVIERAA